MLSINIENHLKQTFPDLIVGCVVAEVSVNPSDEKLRNEMDRLCNKLAPDISPEIIRLMPVVEATKNAYRKLGKDPNRYRPAAESLLRRIASGKGLYYVNNMVDILNMISVQTGYSIGGYDADTIVGDIMFSTGTENEPYEGIGRGILNIEKLPVFRDEMGAFGTSTSDSLRTMVTEQTTRFLMVFPSFFQMETELDDALALAEKLLKEYGNAGSIVTFKVE